MSDTPLNTFLVIGANLSWGKRKLLATQADAAEHGRALLRKEAEQYPAKPNKLYVVQVLEVLAANEPVITSRAPTAADLHQAEEELEDDDCESPPAKAWPSKRRSSGV